MQINVAQQLKSIIGTIRDYEVDAVVDIEGTDDNFHGNIRLMKTDRGILVRGILHTGINLRCSRCLSTFNHSLTLNIDEEYFPVMDIDTGVNLPSPEEPGSFTIDDYNILDLSEAIRQYVLMAVPIKPLCKQECAGLCPTCGTNLNDKTCNCTPDIDPRWSKLKGLVLTETEYSADN